MLLNNGRGEDNDLIKRVANAIESLNERMNATVGMAKDIDTIKEKQSENKEDIRVIKHDLGTLQAIPLLGEKIADNAKILAEHRVEITQLKAWREKVETTTGAYKRIASGMWVLFGGAITAFLVFLIEMYIKFKTGESLGK